MMPTVEMYIWYPIVMPLFTLGIFWLGIFIGTYTRRC